MKSKEQIQDKLKSLENAIQRLRKENFVEESYIVEEEIDYIEGRISILKWILE